MRARFASAFSAIGLRCAVLAGPAALAAQDDFEGVIYTEFVMGGRVGGPGN